MPDRQLLVFGATGGLGRHLLEGLVVRGVDPATVTDAGRNRTRLDELTDHGFSTVRVDLSDVPSVAEVVAGHAEIVLISSDGPNRVQQHRGVIDVAKAAGVGHVYYTSGLRAHDQRFAINADHRATEEALIGSRLTYTIMRSTWYIENYIGSLAGPRHTGVYVAAVGDAMVAPASRKDLGEAPAEVVGG